MITSWFSVAGCELFSDSRAAALTARSEDLACLSNEEYPGLPVYECDTCEGLAEWLTAYCGGGDLGDVTLAPWYDAARPETALIRGIVALGLNGVGGVLGSADDDAQSPTGKRRQFELTWAVLAESELAASAAVAWMADRLDAESCATTCRGFDVCGFAGCPTDGDFEGAMRTIPDMRLVSGPVVETMDSFNSGSQIWQGSLIFETPNPYFLHVSPASSILTLTLGNGNPRTVNLNPDCGDTAPCAEDPDSPLPVLPDLSQGTVDPAWPTAPIVGIGRDWSIVPGVFQRSTVGMRLNITTGALPIRYLSVRLWSNPYGLSCNTIRNRPGADCAACTVLVVKYLPPNSTTVIDGARRFRQVVCVDGGTSVPQMWGPNGGAFSWPVIHCGGGLCIGMAVEGTLDAGARIVAEFVPMDGAA